MVVIGITGPTGAGKTTALRELEKLGGVMIDCDRVYHHLLGTSDAMRAELELRFGNLRGADGKIDRKKLGAVVFHDPNALKALNQITHRYVDFEVRRLLQNARADGCPAVAVDAIALFESGIDRQCQVTVGVLAPAEQRILRIMRREGISQEYAESRVAAQQNDAFFRSRCTHILENNESDPAAFAAKAHRLFESILSNEKY